MARNTMQAVCSNNCKFATRSMMLCYGTKQGDNYIDADYMWRCTIVDQLIMPDAILYKLGCGSYNTRCCNNVNAQAENLIKEVETKIDEINQLIPKVETPIVTPTEPAVSAIPAAEPIVAAPLVASDIPINQITVEKVEKPVVEPKKRKTRVANEPHTDALETPPVVDSPK